VATTRPTPTETDLPEGSRFALLAELEELRAAAGLAQSTLDSLTARVAILDESGAIVAVNVAWRRFAEEDGEQTDLIGGNYLASCAGSEEPFAQAAADAISRTLSGEIGGFELEYPQHTQAERRWFILSVARCAGSEPARVAVRHEESTVHHELRRRASLQEALLDKLNAAVVISDTNGRILRWNRAAEQLYGWPQAEVRGRALAELLEPVDTESGAHVEDEERRGQWDGEYRVKRKDGSAAVVYARMQATQDDDGTHTGVASVAVAVSGRKVFERGGGDRAQRRWIARVQAAIAGDGFELYGQPIVDLETGEVVQRELLLRMRADDRTRPVIAPGLFLHAAEQSGLITEIDRWVINRSAEVASAGGPVELNVSGASISDPSLVDFIRRAIRRTGADPATLVFEITETTLISDEAAARAFVEGLHRLGCRIALDDFGTGYGGFTYLKQLPIDYLKIDIEFIRDVRYDPASRRVVEAVVNLARGFGLRTVGEGVEDEETLELLRTLGVDRVQGFHLGRPAPLGPARFIPAGA
jgi:PAS domain S-box-containing protein